jgi:hypothetical protein
MLFVWDGRWDMRCRLWVDCMARGAVWFCVIRLVVQTDDWKRLYTCRRTSNRHILDSSVTSFFIGNQAIAPSSLLTFDDHLCNLLPSTYMCSICNDLGKLTRGQATSDSKQAVDRTTVLPTKPRLNDRSTVLLLPAKGIEHALYWPPYH